MAAVTLAARRGPVERTLGILELVAERGGASAHELAAALGLPLPTVYRLARELLDSDYLVHIREEKPLRARLQAAPARVSRCTSRSGCPARSAPRSAALHE